MTNQQVPDIDEGYIKFKSYWDKGSEVSVEDRRELARVREKLYTLGLIGEYENGIGFGNLSHKIKGGTLITGTQTGGRKETNGYDFTWITSYSIEQNWVRCKGPVEASSETLTHMALYEISPLVKAVVHVHSKEVWEVFKNKIPTTSKNVPYGTPEMAAAIKLKAEQCEGFDKYGFDELSGAIIMAGHDEGVLAFGENLEQAMQIVLDLYEKAKIS